ncbi:polar amino acid transport system substrate-binding protein [Pseudomonas sp. JUb42]|uniref:transporter substrate-binding domain-containing protein n=1 Tax=Pseudomonas sp. JUb42 TaxID=2940611 RepID=UPI00216A75F1|nr:transporter substrate-binding domain-containing protein [Pseudomonas sp. JUb42]MCS3469723.1 polar amino acid transport system substrate-binding protein [Pseudomonas sp. JUb42]
MSSRRWWMLCWSMLSTLLPIFPATAQEHSSAPVISEIFLVGEPRSDYTDIDGRGLGWDILRLVFEPRGITVKTNSASYVRAVGLVKQGAVDAWVGSYAAETNGVLYPRWHFDADRIYALGLANNPAPSLINLRHYRLAWIHGYQYQRYLPGVSRFEEVLRRDNVLSMLQHSRVDFYIDAQPEVDFLLSQTPRPDLYLATYLTDLPLFLVFSDTDKGRILRTIYDERMEQLIVSGQLRPVFERWKRPYPFEEAGMQTRGSSK